MEAPRMSYSIFFNLSSNLVYQEQIATINGCNVCVE